MPPGLASARAAATLAKEALARQRATRGKAPRRRGRGRREGRGAAPGGAGPARGGRARFCCGARCGRGSVSSSPPRWRRRARGGAGRASIVDILWIEPIAFCVASYPDRHFGLVCEAAAGAQVAVLRRRVVLVRDAEESSHGLQGVSASCYREWSRLRLAVEREARGPAQEYLLVHVYLHQYLFAALERELAALWVPAARSYGGLQLGIRRLERRLHLPLTPLVPLPARNWRMLRVAPLPRHLRPRPPPPAAAHGAPALRWVGAGLRWVAEFALLGALGAALSVWTRRWAAAAQVGGGSAQLGPRAWALCTAGVATGATAVRLLLRAL
eukprot:TRINITY_DN19653_c0_g1_i1.p1 TRINITY_DN19653_c0_g1~~TRINITY_DN19653_c0_g1_i1.p1  ORF type:complete len:351 (+),score=50.12 TRINITY_DN19653_c0_g1_i1:72-1055(+)